MGMKKQVVERKDLIYWIIILVLAIITIFTVKLGDNPDVIGYLGFGGTIVSILLAVVALIYSFIQTAASGNTTAILEDSAKKIESVTNSLKKVDEIVGIADKLESSLTILESLENNVAAATGIFEEGARKFEFAYNDMFNRSEYTQTVKPSDENKSTTDVQYLFEIENLRIKEFAKVELLILYSLILVNDADKVFSLIRFARFVSEKSVSGSKDTEPTLFMITGYFQGVSFQYTRSDLVTLVGDTNIRLKVTKFDSDLKELVLKLSTLDEYEPGYFPKIEDITE